MIEPEEHLLFAYQRRFSRTSIWQAAATVGSRGYITIACGCSAPHACLCGRQWPEVSDFIASFCTLRESKSLRPCENRTRFTRFSHGRRFFDSRNVQKCVTQIIYLGPLPTVREHPARATARGRPCCRECRNDPGALCGCAPCPFAPILAPPAAVPLIPVPAVALLPIPRPPFLSHSGRRATGVRKGWGRAWRVAHHLLRSRPKNPPHGYGASMRLRAYGASMQGRFGCEALPSLVHRLGDLPAAVVLHESAVCICRMQWVDHACG